MYKFIFLLLALVYSFRISAQSPCIDGLAGIYPCNEIDLLSFVPLSDVGSPANTNDIWGWVSPVTQKEYALLGCSNGTAFLDLSNPVNPVYLGTLPTHTVNSLWRDLETYGNYCFIVSEAPDHGLQIFDLLQLDLVQNAPVVFSESAHYGEFGHCHTLNINTTTGYCYCMGTNTFDGGLHIVDISDPMSPSLAGGFSADGYTHDGFVWSYDGPDLSFLGKELMFACNEDQLSIVDVTDKSDCHLVAAYDYEGQTEVGYIHQGWVTKDKKHFLVDDELDEVALGNNQEPYGTRTHIFDIEQIENVAYLGFYEGASTSIDHNLYVLDQFVYESNYRSGIRVLDAVHVSDGILNEVAYFDLFPMNDFAQFSGTWSNYPYFPSGINIATSMYDGFFVMKPTLIELSQESWDLCGTDEIIFDLSVNVELAFPLEISIDGLPGAIITGNTISEAGVTSVAVSGIAQIASGTYYPDILLGTNFNESYVVPFEIHIANGVSEAPVLINVPDGASVSNTANSTLFEWQALSSANQYEFQLATSENFADPIEVEITDGTNYLMTFDLPDGSYFWRVRSINECGTSSWSDVFEFAVQLVGLENYSSEKMFVYPNPANDIIVVSSAYEINEITISDVSGRIVNVQSYQSNSKQITINIEMLDSGVYFMLCDQKLFRFIKE
jgi:choice-of-anchor B domain-containing protein